MHDEYIEKYLVEDKAGIRKLDLAMTTDAVAVYSIAGFVIIAVPTNYDYVT